MSATFLLYDPNITVLSLFRSFLNTVISVFVMVDPFAAIPIYLSLTKPLSHADTLQTTKQCNLIALGILVFFAITGIGLLNFFRISLAALRIAGGLLLLKFAFEQMQGNVQKIKQDEETESLRRNSIAVVPLAMPLIAGPGAISTVIVQSSNATNLVTFLIFIVGIALVIWANYLILRSSRYLFKILGQTGLNLVDKLMSIIVAAIAIQFILTGIAETFPKL